MFRAPSLDEAGGDVSVNYLFIGEETSPQFGPVRITLPRSLFDGSCIRCRDKFSEEILNEFRVEVPKQNIGFWKPKPPFPLDEPYQPQWSEVLAKFKGNFAAIPLTRSLSAAIEGTIHNKESIHLVVTSSPTRYNMASIPLPVVPGPPAVDSLARSISTGTYSTSITGSGRGISTTEGERHTDYVSFPERSSIPAMILGIREIHVGSHDDEIHTLSYVNNIHRDGFQWHLGVSGRTHLYDARLDWFVADQSPLLQTGSVDSQLYRPQKTGGAISKRVTFRRAFAVLPRVLVAISGFSVGGKKVKNWELRTFATGIDSQGFTINIIGVKDDGALANGQVHWIAFREGGVPGRRMSCGEFRLDTSDSGNLTGHTDFDVGFPSPPLIFVGLNHFDARRSTNIHVRLQTSNVTKTGMDWKIENRSDTALYHASASFIAVENLQHPDPGNTPATSGSRSISS